MADYEAHAQAASDILARIKIHGMTVTPDLLTQVAQVQALLALAAAIAGRQTAASSQPPPYPPNGITDSY
ncbi:hypothetical protein G3I60_08915 [Streptomyces sp. SID13666]|uniref:hypothetical protein n=1 Tax=unclassified Streptomyces TaxID=2593676 RepID=UPI0013BFA17D|nr:MULTISPECIES: hypothetical protein [unclassified Streptomyces]NEA54268.1 hypothetical protein [Streptomyces sp. SID13666]NEA70363.1 hypothetical protein [Streptomyces sp. SID13588]